MRARNFAGRQAAAHLAGDEPAMPQALILSTKRSIAHARHSARLKPFRSPLQCNASPGTLDTLQVTAARLQPVPRTHQPARLRLLGDWRHTPLFREASGTIAPPSGHLRELQHAGVECSLLSCRWLAASSVQGPRARFARVAGMHCSCSSGDSTCSSRQIMSQWCTCALRASQSRCPRLQSAAKRPSA